MPNTKKGQRRAQGIPGPPGPAGPRGATGGQGDRGAAGARGVKGTTGARGAKGATGEQGAKGTSEPHERRKLLRNVNNQIEDINKQLEIQLRRMAQIQQQVDELRATIRRLSD